MDPQGSPRLYPELEQTVGELLGTADRIPASRRARLEGLARYLNPSGPIALAFICTHNSRRSQIAQCWAAVAGARTGREGISTHSAGTEATAFNPRAVAALRRAGFQIPEAGGENPVYEVGFSSGAPPVRCFSKALDHPSLPGQDFAAIMTCAEADAACPYVPGAAFRLSLPFEDPKASDGSPAESARYDEAVARIGREILFAFRRAAGEWPRASE